MRFKGILKMFMIVARARQNNKNMPSNERIDIIIHLICILVSNWSESTG